VKGYYPDNEQVRAEFPDLRSRIVQEWRLTEITGDNNSPVVDAEPVMILRLPASTTSLGVAQSTTYTTRTIFGSGAPGKL